MTKPALFKFVIAVTTLFVCSAIPAFSGRGGGGGHGGGGSHGGGGGSRGGAGGGFRGGSSSGPRMGAGISRPAASAPVRSGGNEYRSSSGAVNGSQRGAISSSVPRGVADGQWHSFGSPSASRGSAASASEARASGSAEGGWHVFSGNRTAGSGVARSFSGQGNEVWETTSAARNVVPSSSALSGIRGSFANSFAGTSGLRSNASLSASSRFAAGSIGAVGFRNTPLFGNNLNRFGLGFRGGCWNCGFGFGFGLWPGWGFGFWDPFYWDSLSWGWPGYGYNGYPAGYPYGYSPYDNGYDSGYPDSASPDSYPNPDESSPSAEPMAQSSPQSFSVANSAVPIILFLKDDSVYSVRDYWVSSGQLHYILLNGREGAFDADRLDMQRTVDENAKSGVQFVLKPDPSGFAPASGNPDSAPGNPNEAPPATTPSPAPRIDLTSGPELHS